MMHIDTLQLSQLRLVEAIARTGSLGDAADEVGLTQSAASHALARLRTELKDQIFVRGSRGMRPTPYGLQLASAVKEALKTLDRGLERYPEFAPHKATNTFNIVMSDVGQFLNLPRLLATLSAEAPHVTIRVPEMPHKAPHLLFESGEIDLAVGAFTKIIVGCRQRRLYREKYACVARIDHPAFKNGMTQEAFATVPHVAVDPRGHVHEKLDFMLGEQKLARKAVLYVPYFASLLPAIVNSDLLAVMSNRMAQQFAKMAPVKVMQPPVRLPVYSVSMFWHERLDKDPANQWLRKVHIEAFSDNARVGF